MNKKDDYTEDALIRAMLQGAQEKAPDNLKHRIMHQIEAEHAVAPRKVKATRDTGNVLREMGVIFGTMYAVLAGMIGVAYVIFGAEFLLSTEFIGASVFVAFVFSMLWLIAQLDRRLRGKLDEHAKEARVAD